MPDPIRIDASELDLSKRISVTTAVAGSPAAASETIVSSLTLKQDVVVATGILVFAFVAFTVGTSGVSALFQLRPTDTSGTVFGATDATTVAAGNLKAMDCMGLLVAPTLPGQVIVATLTIGSGAAASTVSKAVLAAFVV